MNNWKLYDWTVKGITVLLLMLGIVASIALSVAVIFGSVKFIMWLM